MKKSTLHLPFVPGAKVEPTALEASTRPPTQQNTLVEKFQHALGNDRYDMSEAKQRHETAQRQFQAATATQGSDRASQFEKAAKDYAAASKRCAGTSLAEDCLMMSAESYFFADLYPKAVERYSELIKKHPNTRYLDLVDQRRFAIARYWLALKKQDSSMEVVNLTNSERPATDTFSYAVKLLDRIRFDNPTGKLADDATMAAATANFEQGKFAEADVLFTDIRENFPQSEFQFQAHLLGLKCKQELYEGPDYDGGMLVEGEKIINQMVQYFPQESATHREHLESELKDIRLKIAQRDYTMAKFYDSKKEYGAARVYYDLVRSDHKNTNLALESEARLAQIGGLPTDPENSMQWLADMFPKEEPPKPLIARKTVGSVKR